MPRNPINYSKTLFYKLVCKDITITDLYVGHTTNFRQRKNDHKSRCNNENNTSYKSLVYKCIRENGGWENWDMIVIHRQSCIDVNDAKAVERGYIESLPAILNCNTPSTYIQAYRTGNKDDQREYNQSYYARNKEEILIDQGDYYNLNRERILSRVQTYAGNNKEKIAEFQKGYYERNKEVIKERSRKAREKKKLLKQESLGV
jgi:hypothetical protein